MTIYKVIYRYDTGIGEFIDEEGRTIHYLNK